MYDGYISFISDSLSATDELSPPFVNPQVITVPSSFKASNSPLKD